MQRAVQLLICVKNDVRVYVIEKCELILGGCVCHVFTQRGALFRYMWMFMYRNVACS